MIIPNDFYTNLGSASIRTCWTSDVTKFDASSFYNWEQDDLPILDLEERTDFLWGRLGTPTSAVNGFSWVVSATATSDCTGDYFPTLSAALDKLPEVINAPYIIEIANLGDLGTLQLSNKIFGPRGSIEIVNRVMGNIGPAPHATFAYNSEKLRSGDVYGTASAVYIPNAILQLAAPATVMPSLASDLYGNRVKLNKAVFSSVLTTNASLSGNLTVFTRKNRPDINNRMTAALSSKNAVVPYEVAEITTIQPIKFNAYEISPETNDAINTYDASCINEISNTEIVWAAIGEGEDYPAVSIAYANKLQSVKVLNCNGPIYLRGLTVDGSGYGGREYGFEIKNSAVNLENCSVARCTKAGLLAVNSDVTILKGFVAYRNYSFDISGNRSTGPWLTKIKNPNRVSGQSTLAAGIDLVNSNLTYKSTYARDYALYASAFATGDYANVLTNTGIFLGLTGIDQYIPVPSYTWLNCLSKNDIGIKAHNSTINGGKNELDGSAAISYYDSSELVLELNTEAGMLLSNSKVNYDGKLYFYGNYVGLNSEGSELSLESINCKYNQKEAIDLKNSKLKYNKDLYRIYDFAAAKNHQVGLFLNGTHLKLTNSEFSYTDGPSLPDLYDRFVASGSFGITQDISSQRGLKPGIIVDSNSKLNLIHVGVETSESFTDTGKPLFGSISVTDGSELVLNGTKNYATKIIGPTGYTNQENKCGLYAGNHSTIKIHGPTVIAKFAVDALADNSSKIEIAPHRDSEGRLNVSSFNLADRTNHTSVELHSTRACLVADNNSILTFEDLGDYRTFWNRGAYGSSVVLSGIDYLTGDSGKLNYATYTSGGSLQFYPNPNDILHYPPGTDSPAITLYSNNAMAENAYGYNCFFVTALGDVAQNQTLSSITLGGMCLRALNGSKVNVDNTHFPCGWWNPSGVIYDVSGAESPLNCNRTFIWNIADLSQLDAKLVSVSGLHPADAAYFGPSGVWGAASAAPLTTPNTSSVSILDLYGRSTNHRYSNPSALNQGPFRLYFSVDPAVNWALNTSLQGSGYAAQVYSQGYQFSGNLVFPGTVSSAYKSIIKESGSSLVVSGFYYANELLESPDAVRALLDDSAANTFANAKHNSVGKSNLGKVVSIYYPYTGVYGGDSAGSQYKDAGRGVKSVNTFDLEKSN